MHQIFAIKDEKTGAFEKPIIIRSAPDLVRAMETVLKRPEPDGPTWSNWPGDFSVWRLGVWHEDQGTIDVLFEKEWVFAVSSIVPPVPVGPSPTVGLKPGKEV